MVATLRCGVHQMAGPDKENRVADKRVDVSVDAVPVNAANTDDPSPVLVPSLSSSRSGTADADVPVPSSHFAPVFGSTSLLTGAPGAGDRASNDTRFFCRLSVYLKIYV